MSSAANAAVVRMKVPCCGGLTRLADAAQVLAPAELSEIVVSLDGGIIGTSRD